MIGSLPSKLLCQLIGLALPAYHTFKCVRSCASFQRPEAAVPVASSAPGESPRGDSGDQLTSEQFASLLIEANARQMRWLKFWTVTAAFLLLEWWTDSLLFWVPFYYEAKLAFVLYCCLPQTDGASKMYDCYLEPWLRTHEVDIDQRLSNVSTNGLVLAKQAWRRAASGAAVQLRTVLSEYPSAAPLVVICDAVVAASVVEAPKAEEAREAASIDSPLAPVDTCLPIAPLARASVPSAQPTARAVMQKQRSAERQQPAAASSVAPRVMRGAPVAGRRPALSLPPLSAAGVE